MEYSLSQTPPSYRGSTLHHLFTSAGVSMAPASSFQPFQSLFRDQESTDPNLTPLHCAGRYSSVENLEFSSLTVVELSLSQSSQGNEPGL